MESSSCSNGTVLEVRSWKCVSFQKGATYEVAQYFSVSLRDDGKSTLCAIKVNGNDAFYPHSFPSHVDFRHSWHFTIRISSLYVWSQWSNGGGIIDTVICNKYRFVHVTVTLLFYPWRRQYVCFETIYSFVSSLSYIYLWLWWKMTFCHVI